MEVNIMGGEIAQVETKIKELEQALNFIDNEEYRAARKIWEDVDFDRKYRVDTLTHEERERNDQLLHNAIAILNKYEQSDKQPALAQIKRLRTGLNDLHNEAARFKRHYEFLNTEFKQRLNITVAGYQKEVDFWSRKLTMQQQSFVNEVEAIETEIKQLQARLKVLDKPQNKIKGLFTTNVKMEILDIEAQITSLGVEKEKLIQYRYPAIKQNIDQSKHYITFNQSQINAVEKNYQDGLTQCRQGYRRITGEELPVMDEPA